MRKLLGAILIVGAIMALIVVYILIAKKGTYRGDFCGLIIDSLEFLGIIGALILLGIVLIKT